MPHDLTSHRLTTHARVPHSCSLVKPKQHEAEIAPKYFSEQPDALKSLLPQMTRTATWSHSGENGSAFRTVVDACTATPDHSVATPVRVEATPCGVREKQHFCRSFAITYAFAYETKRTENAPLTTMQ